MKRQRDETITTRVYSYGAVPARVAAVRNEEAALAQMRLGQRLWNVLVAIERARHDRYIRIMADETSARIAELTAAIEAGREEIRERRKLARKRAVPTGDVTPRIEEWREERKRLIAAQQESKQERHEGRRVELAALAEATKRRIKRARQAAASMGLFWGSYNDIVQRADAGRKLGDLQFRGFRGQGTVTAQIMGGMAVGVVTEQGGNQFFQIAAETAGQKWRYARMRIGSDAARGPVWLEIPIVFHRELPADGQIKSVSMTRRVVAGWPRWQLNVTCNVAKPQPKAGMAIAVDIGWRVIEAGVRVAYWQDEAGRSGEVVVQARDLGEFGRVRSLGSICDTMREEFLPGLAAWLGALELPEEWQQEAAHLGQWRSNDRLARLIRWWSDHRLPEDGGWYFGARQWRQKYLHLANWQRSLQDQLVLRIQEQYRVWAAGVARRYGTVVIEHFDLRRVAVVPEPEGEARQKDYRQRVSPSTLRAAVRNACQREGLAVVELPAEWTTATCHMCGKRCEWDHGELVHRCEHCGAMWDQDANAAANLLQQWLASAGMVAEVMA